MNAIICVSRVIVIKELLMELVKGKEINSQPCYDSGEVTSFNIPEVETLVGDIFVDVYVLIIDDYPADMETRTSISDDPEDGIMPINVTSRGEDVLPPPPQPILESKDEINGFRLCISLYGDFSNNKTKQYMNYELCIPSCLT
ncbi:hypothetical protein IC575_020464 [Cucumis melo]